MDAIDTHRRRFTRGNEKANGQISAPVRRHKTKTPERSRRNEKYGARTRWRKLTKSEWLPLSFSEPSMLADIRSCRSRKCSRLGTERISHLRGRFRLCRSNHLCCAIQPEKFSWKQI